MRWILLLAALTIGAPPLALPLSADPAPLEKLGWTVNGTADAATQIGNVLYVGGQFTRVSPFAAMLGSLYRLSTASGQPMGVLPAVDRQVFAIEPDGAGGYYVGGNFTTVGGQARAGLAHILGDGTVDPAFHPLLGTNAMVTSIARDGTRLFIAGSFPSLFSTLRGTLAAIDAASGAVTPWIPAASGRKAVVAAGRLVVIGYISLGVGATALDLVSGAVVWQRTLGRDSIKPSNQFSSINDIIVSGDRLIVGGRFGASTGFGPVTCAGTLAWLNAASGDVDSTWAPSTQDCGEVHSLAAGDGTLYVGGAFTRLGGQNRTNVAAVSLSTGVVTSWAPQPDQSVTALAVSATGNVYLGGAFTTVLNQPRDGLAEITAAQTLAPWTANAYPRFVYDIVSVDGSSIVVGSSEAVSGGTARRNLAAFDVSTGALLDWRPTTDGQVVAMASNEITVFVAGNFETVSGHARRSLVALDATTGTVRAWNANARFMLYVQSMVAYRDHLYVAASIPAALRRLHHLTGAIDESWTPAVEVSPRAMLAHEDRLYVGGSHTLATPAGLAAIDLVTGQLLPWAPTGAGGSVFALARADQTLFVGGSFSSLAGQPRQSLGAFDLGTGELTPWAPGANERVTSLAVADRAVVAGGNFTTLAGQARNGLGAVSFSGAPTAWNPEHGPPKTFVVGATDLSIVGAESPLVFSSDISTFALSGAPRPSNLRATATGALVTLTWDPPAGVTPLAYRIEAGTRPGSSNLGRFQIGGATTSVSTPAPDGVYYLRVRGVLAADEPSTEPTNEVIVLVGCTAPPPPPVGLQVQLSGSTVTLRWTPAPMARSHVLEFGTAHRAADLGRVSVPEGQTMFETAAPAGRYFARARSVNACGAGSASADVMFTVGAGVPLPAAPSGLDATVHNGILALTWTAPPGSITGYVIEGGSASGLADLATIAVGATPSLQVPGLPPGIYYVRVRAVNEAGTGPPSADVVVVR